MSQNSPCMSCGACCGFFRVSFYWGECQSAGGLVPDELTIPVNQTRVCMNGTQGKPSRCNSLLGTIGEGVRCTIYENRPSPCREFAMHGEMGVANDDCNRARAHYGLPPLEIVPDEWIPLIDQPLPEMPEVV